MKTVQFPYTDRSHLRKSNFLHEKTSTAQHALYFDYHNHDTTEMTETLQSNIEILQKLVPLTSIVSFSL